MKKTIFSILFCWIFGPSAFSQIDFFSSWDSLYASPFPERIHQIIQLSDGRLAAVGETDRPNRGRDGLFLIIDGDSGKILARKTFGTRRDDALLSLCETHDGAFCLVGFSDIGGADGRQGWLLKLDEQGNEITELKQGLGGEERFEKIVWLDNGTGLIAGFSESISEGDIWLLSYDNDQLEGRDPVGQHIAEDLIALERTQDGRVWLAGNTRKSDISKKGDVWVSCLGPDGKIISNLETTLGDRTLEQAWSAQATFDGSLLIVGETYGTVTGEKDIWLAEVDPSGSGVPRIFSGGSDNADFGRSACRLPDGQWLVAVEPRAGVPPRLARLDENFDFEAIHQFRNKDAETFEVARLFRTFQQNLFVVGSARSKKTGFDAIRIVCLPLGASLASKSTAKVECSEITFKDADRNGILTPDEDAALQFRLTNVGSTLLDDGKIEIVVEASVNGVKVGKTLYRPAISAGASQLLNVPIHADKMVENGTFRLKFLIKHNQTQLAEVFSSFKCVDKKPIATASATVVNSSSESTRLTYREPDLTLTGSREVVAGENNYTIKINASSSKKLDNANFKVYKNGSVQEDQKTTGRSMSSPVFQSNRFDAVFSYRIDGLEEGENRIVVRYDDFLTDTLTIHFQPKKPNLHVLAIGPTYDDLAFPAKDARDFAEAIQQQATLGFYDQIFVDLYETPVKTTKTNIQLAFSKLYKRSKVKDDPKHIKQNDYLIVFYSGHGVIRREDLHFCLAPTDYVSDTNEEEFESTVDFKDMIEKYINNIQCKKVLFIDACHSGKGAKRPTQNTLSQALLEANKAAAGTTSFASCAETQVSYEGDEWKNGAFTEALLELLDGKTVDLLSGEKLASDLPATDSRIDLGEAINFLKKRVPDLVQSAKQSAHQTPTVPINDLPEDLTLFILK